MAIAKVIEVIAQSEKSWDDAAEIALREAKKSVRNIKTMYIKDMQCTVEDGKIANYRLDAKITFVVED